MLELAGSASSMCVCVCFVTSVFLLEMCKRIVNFKSALHQHWFLFFVFSSVLYHMNAGRLDVLVTILKPSVVIRHFRKQFNFPSDTSFPPPTPTSNPVHARTHVVQQQCPTTFHPSSAHFARNHTIFLPHSFYISYTVSVIGFICSRLYAVLSVYYTILWGECHPQNLYGRLRRR